MRKTFLADKKTENNSVSKTFNMEIYVLSGFAELSKCLLTDFPRWHEGQRNELVDNPEVVIFLSKHILRLSQISDQKLIQWSLTL